MSNEEAEMDGFEIMTWVAALLLVILGLGFPKGGWLGSPESSEGERETFRSGDDEYMVEGSAD